MCEPDSKNCTLCESKGIIDFNGFKRIQDSIEVKVLVQGLPMGINESGIKNLFVNVGNPLAINYLPHKRNAFVQFASLNEAELAIRDLHKKPPYNLIVHLLTGKANQGNYFKVFKAPAEDTSTSGEAGGDQSLAKEEISLTGKPIFEKDASKLTDSRQLMYESVNYGPSYRIHQKVTDYKIKNGHSVSRGRGYFYDGDDNTSVGGLQAYHVTSENGEELPQNGQVCNLCQGPTTKTCNQCTKFYCSKLCLYECPAHKRSSCLNWMIESESDNSETLSNGELDEGCENMAPLQSPCTVVLCMYSTLRSVYVRRTDTVWDEKFSRVCNDVAVEAITARTIDTAMPGKFCIAKYREDGSFNRAKIISVNGDRINVLFIDFGNVQETNLTDLKYLPGKLMKCPALAVNVNLADIPSGTSADAIHYYNDLILDGVTLTLRYGASLDNGVVLTEKDTTVNVNEKIKNCVLPSWRKDPAVLSKSGEVFIMDSVQNYSLEAGKTYDLTLSCLDKAEYEKSSCFWMVDRQSDYFLYLNEELKVRIREYCEYLEEEDSAYCYLPRDNELCLAKDNGEWFRCVNLNSENTTCYLFFIDVGKTDSVDTKDIRKMISDFLACPALALCCSLSEGSEGERQERQSKAYKYLNSMTDQTVNSVLVNDIKDGRTIVTFPNFNP